MHATTFNISDHYRLLTRQLLARDEISGSYFDHGDLLGSQSENIVRDLLRKFVRPNISVETGQIVSLNGSRSKQQDVIIFHNVPGAIVGVTESEQCLVRMEAVICMVEVKRSIVGPRITEIQSYFRHINDHFVSAGRTQNWNQWCFAFRSDKTAPTLLKELQDSYDPVKSVGALVVLDVPYTDDELAQFAQEVCIEEPSVPKGSRRRKRSVRIERMEAVVQKVKYPNSFLFARDKTQKYILRAQPNVPPCWNS